MLTSPRAAREISRSSVLAAQVRLTAFAYWAVETSSVESLKLRHIWWPRTSFRFVCVFSSLGVCLRREVRVAARIAGPVVILCALPGFASAQSTWVGTTSDWNTPSNWNPTGVPTGTAIFNPSTPTSITSSAAITIPTLQFNAPGYTLALGSGLSITGNGIEATAANAPNFPFPVGQGAGFINSSTAGPAFMNVFGLGAMDFRNTSNAGTAKITLGVEGSTDDFAGGFLLFHDSSTADHATITAFGDSNIEFHDASDAGNAILTAGLPTRPTGADTNGFIFFSGTSTADHATITVNQFAELSFAPDFQGGGTATAGNANITNNGNTNFFQGSSAENATITTNDGGLTRFFGRSTGGNATFITNAGGTVDISGLGTFPDGPDEGLPSVPMTAGSIAGAGTYFLGSNQLTVGSNNLSTEVSGILQDGGEAGGVGGSLVKVGTGTLTLSGADTYTGGTTINSGTLQLGDGGTSGSIIGGVVDSAGATLAFDRSDIMTFAGVISGTGAVSQIGTGTTVLTADNPYTGGTTISAGTLAVGDFAHSTAALSGGGQIAVEAGGTLGGYGSVTGPVSNSGVIAAGSATPGFLGSPTGTFTALSHQPFLLISTYRFARAGLNKINGLGIRSKTASAPILARCDNARAREDYRRGRVLAARSLRSAAGGGRQNARIDAPASFTPARRWRETERAS
jgi:autotransporter-associated beta strand protein